MSALPPGYKRPRCKARARSREGEQCRNPSIPGGFVCRFHGGSTPNAKKAAAQRLADLIDPDRVLRETAALAYSDVRALFDEKGNVLPVKQWPDGLAAAVASVEVVKRNMTAGDGHTDDVIKIRLWDKPKAVEMLMKHLGLLTEKLEHTGGLEIRWQSSE